MVKIGGKLVNVVFECPLIQNINFEYDCQEIFLAKKMENFLLLRNTVVGGVDFPIRADIGQ